MVALSTSFNSLSRDHYTKLNVSEPLYDPFAFNSLSRDHPVEKTLDAFGRPAKLSTPSLGITEVASGGAQSQGAELSTPSIGITLCHNEARHKPKHRVKLSTPSLGITAISSRMRTSAPSTFNSLSRDHMSVVSE